MAFSHTAFYDTNVNVTYLLEGHWTSVRMLQLFLTVRRLASTYWTKDVKGLETVHTCQIIHIWSLVFQSRKQEQNVPEQKEWQSGLHHVWEPKKKETTQKSCIIQNQNSDNHWVSSLVRALHVTCQYTEQYLKTRLSLRLNRVCYALFLHCFCSFSLVCTAAAELNDLLQKCSWRWSLLQSLVLNLFKHSCLKVSGEPEDFDLLSQLCTDWDKLCLKLC